MLMQMHGNFLSKAKAGDIYSLSSIR